LKRILIIDDDPVFAKICESLLRGAGFIVDVAEGGERALETLRTRQPDLILLDLHMRKMSGVRVLKHIRSRLATSDTPVIAFSGASTSRLVEGVWDAGANRFLAKDDFEPNRFLEIIRATLAAANPAAPAPSAMGKAHPETASSSTVPPPSATAAPADPFAQKMETLESLKTDLRQTFLNNAPPILNAMRSQLQSVIKAEDEGARVSHLCKLCQTIQDLPQNAGRIGFLRIEQLSKLLETLALELLEEPEEINASVSHTMAGAIEFLGDLIEQAAVPELEKFASAVALVVDDDTTSRWMISSALELANLKSVGLSDPRQAVRTLEESRFELIILDLQMPGMNGLELCETIRQRPAYETIPVVFVTSRADFESRARSTLAGSNDFMAKPFLLSELAVKALTHVLKNRLNALRTKPAQD
jgi:CheY-like chemotaxis protein